MTVPLLVIVIGPVYFWVGLKPAALGPVLLAPPNAALPEPLDGPPVGGVVGGGVGVVVGGVVGFGVGVGFGVVGGVVGVGVVVGGAVGPPGVDEPLAGTNSTSAQ
jgi:hypothetical protein